MPGGYEWITGRSDIMSWLGVKDWSSVSFLEAHGLPIRRPPNRKPVLIPFEACTWLIKFDDANKKRKKGGDHEETRSKGRPFGYKGTAKVPC